MGLWLFVIFLIHHVHTISIGHISNVSLILTATSTSITMNGTKETCLCDMIASSNITALNYFSNNTCELFSNESLTNAYFSWITDIDSTFYFLQLPTSPNSSACAIVNSSLMGSTVFGNANGTAGESLSELKYPWSITVNGDKSMLITDTANDRVLLVLENGYVSVVATANVSGLVSRRAYFDHSGLDLFVIDTDFCRMRRYRNKSQLFTTVFGGICGTNLTQFGTLASFCMDSTGNFYVADNNNHRIMLWAANSTNGVLLAGTTGMPGNDASHLYHPQDIIVDEANQFIYVADTYNHRIIKYSLSNRSGIVVAGGNGRGMASNQLNEPSGLYLSQRTDILYIADTANNRIVRWELGASEGTTIIGDCNGIAGNSAYHLNTPTTIAMDKEEEYLYVSDYGNHRIQQFTLDQRLSSTTRAFVPLG